MAGGITFGRAVAGGIGMNEAGSVGQNLRNGQPPSMQDAVTATGEAVGAEAGSRAAAIAAGAARGALRGELAGLLEGPVGEIGGPIVGALIGGYTAASLFAPMSNPYADITEPLGGTLCFSGSTCIAMSNGTCKDISDIRVGDTVECFSHESTMSPLIKGYVKNIFTNITNEWLLLSNGVSVTPGHRFLNENGQFEAINSIVNRGGRLSHVLVS